MAKGKMGDEWDRWALYFSIYSAAHGIERTPNYYLPPDLKVKQEKAEPTAKISLRQLAAAQGHHFGGDNGIGS